MPGRDKVPMKTFGQIVTAKVREMAETKVRESYRGLDAVEEEIRVRREAERLTDELADRLIQLLLKDEL